MSSQNVSYDPNTTLTANAFTKTGHSFMGWSTASGIKGLINESTEFSGSSASNSSNYTNVKQYTVNQPFATGQVYRLEADIKGYGELWTFFYGTTNYLQVASSVNSLGDTSSRSDGGITVKLTSDYKHYTVTWTLGSIGATNVNKYILFRVFPGYSVTIKNVKLYKLTSSSDKIYTDCEKLSNLLDGEEYNLYAIWK